MPASVSREDVRALRGTKRTCQNADCGARFYDLNKDPITCPVCAEVHEFAVKAVPPPAPEKKARPEPKRYETKDEKAAPEEELALPGGEDAEEGGESDEVFLEGMEEEPSSVSGMIDAPLANDDEKA